MPRVNGVMQLPPGTYGVPGQKVASAKYNAAVDDFVAEMNSPRPISAGGSGANNLADAKTALGISFQDVVTPGGPLGGFRNRLINSNGDVNRRAYVSGTATTTAAQYTLDRWRVVTLGQNLAWTLANGVRTFTAPADGVEQVIEGVNIAPGIHTVSWTGTATAKVDGVTVANGDEVTIIGGANVTIRMSAGTFSGLQFEQGAEKTAVERRPLSVEQTLCERYFRLQRSSYNGDVGGGNYVDVRQFNEMRVAPTAAVVTQGGLGNSNFYPRAAQSTSINHAVFFAQAITTTTSGGWSDVWSLNAEL